MLKQKTCRCISSIKSYDCKKNFRTEYSNFLPIIFDKTGADPILILNELLNKNRKIRNNIKHYAKQGDANSTTEQRA